MHSSHVPIGLVSEHPFSSTSVPLEYQFTKMGRAMGRCWLSKAVPRSTAKSGIVSLGTHFCRQAACFCSSILPSALGPDSGCTVIQDAPLFGQSISFFSHILQMIINKAVAIVICFENEKVQINRGVVSQFS